jgi:nucleotide-binding universal stress UspA family protein
VRNRVLVYAEAVDVAAEGAVWYARRIGGGTFSALHVPGKHTDTGINARWFDLTGGEPRLDVRPPGTDATKAVLEEIAKLRGSGHDVVTVVLPEQFSKRSLMAAAQRDQFRLKLRLLVEPGVVVADVPAVTSERRPEGRLPERLMVRVVAGQIDDAALRAAAYARELGESDVRAVHFGDDRDWADDELGLPVDDAPEPGKLGEAMLSYVRRFTDDAGTAVNIVLPERLDLNLRWLRGRRALAIKRCLLFEPHVILSSVPHANGVGERQ